MACLFCWAVLFLGAKGVLLESAVADEQTSQPQLVQQSPERQIRSELEELKSQEESANKDIELLQASGGEPRRERYLEEKLSLLERLESASSRKATSTGAKRH